MIQILLSQIGSLDEFASAVAAHQKALITQQMGKPGKPAPVAPQWVDLVIARVPQSGPVKSRGPDQFVVQPYTIIDDRPMSPEAQQAISTLRETIQS